MVGPGGALLPLPNQQPPSVLGNKRANGPGAPGQGVKKRQRGPLTVADIVQDTITPLAQDYWVRLFF